MKIRYLIVFGFLGLIAAGAAFFTLPVAGGLGWGDALFTACSATCITGLSVIDPGTQLTRAGQIALMALVEAGCVGIMTLGTFFLVCTGRRLSLASEFSVSSAFGGSGVKGLKGLVVWVVLSMLVVEALGAWALSSQLEGDWYRSVFYSVMAFCNAGFSLSPESLAPFRSQPVVLYVLGLQVVLGGFGFLVLYNLCTIRFWQRNRVTRGRLTLHSRIVLSSSLLFVVLAFVLFMACEWRTALAPFGWSERLAVGFFQAVTPRTCGFTVVPVESWHDVTRFLSGVLMFIGAAPGGAGGGIKVTTLVVTLATLAAIYHGRKTTVLFNRTVSEEIVRESLIIVVFYGAVVAAVMTALLVTESGRAGLSFENLLYEAVSATTTTGLSCGNTTKLLSPSGRIAIMTAMFLGRLGALSVVLLMAGKEEPESIRYPKEEVVVG